jgi:uncharacterized protein (TIGR03437 family)
MEDSMEWISGLLAIMIPLGWFPQPKAVVPHRQERLEKLPFLFETGPQSEFRAQSRGFRVGIRPGEIVMESKGRRTALRFLGSNRQAREEGLGETGKVNYLVGSDPARWRTDVSAFARIRYRELYPGVDLECYGTGGTLEYDLLVAPGRNPEQIEMAWDGGAALELNASGELSLPLAGLRLRKPVMYQDLKGLRQFVEGGYRITGRNRVRFRVGPYDHTRTLVIDPVVFSTYLGGSGDENLAYASDDFATTAVAVDLDGNMYVTGNTTSLDFPLAAPFQATSKANGEVFIAKLDPTGSKLLYCTYFGGSSGDRAFGIAVDSAGSAYVAGRTHSPDLPVANAFQPSLRRYEAGFLVKLSPDGRSLVFATYLGGLNNDDITAVAVDAAGSAYVVGETQSADFPLANAAQTRFGGNFDAFVTKFSPEGDKLVYSTLLGGARGDDLQGITVDYSGYAYVAGYTTSADLPTVNPLQSKFAGTSSQPNALIARLDPRGALIYCTYLGTSSGELGLGVAADSSGNAYVAGLTAGSNFPVTQDAFQKTFGGGAADAFLIKLNASGSNLTYSTYLGGTGNDVGMAVSLGSFGDVFLTGSTDSPDLPQVGADLQQGYGGGPADGFVAALTGSPIRPRYLSYFGGGGQDNSMAMAVDAAGGVYLAGVTATQSSFATHGAVQATYGGGRSDGFAAKVTTNQTKLLVPLPAASSNRATGYAPGAIVSAWGSGLCNTTEIGAASPMPTVLAGCAVLVYDSAGKTQLAPLYFVSPGQINFLLPDDTPPGPARIQVGNQLPPGTNNFLILSVGMIEVGGVGPALFSMSADGKGPAAAVAIRYAADGSSSWQYTGGCGAAPASCATVPIDLGSAADQAILQLYGSGIRGRSSLASVSSRIGGETAEVLYAGAQGQYAGLDQVNVRLPRSLAGRGEVDVVLTADGKTANTVRINVK